jgi:hypothetical protein
MKKLTLVLIVVVFSAFGCTHSYNSMPVSGVGVDMKGGADCEILGDTQATANVSKILGIPFGDASLFTGITGSFPAAAAAGLIPASTRQLCEQAAAYKAIENFEGADQIICPRFKTELTFGLGKIFESYTTTLKAKAVKIKP